MTRKRRMPCKHCDVPGGNKTWDGQVIMPIGRKVQRIDHCIHGIVAALNAGGVATTSSCCGHGEFHGSISLEDGRVLMILPQTPKNMEEWGKAIFAT